jgi:hypothetical protein
MTGNPRPARLVLAGLVAGMLAVVGAAGPARADPDPGAKGRPDPAVPSAPACTQRGAGEFASCLGVTAALDRAPAVGETATLTVTVRASRKLAATQVTVDLPGQLGWATTPAGFRAGRATSRRPERSGTTTTAQRTITVDAGRPFTTTGVVKAVTPGFGQLQVRARAPEGGTVHDGVADVYLTVAGAGAASRFGAQPAAEHGRTATLARAPARVAQRPAGLKPQSVGTAGLEPPKAGLAACDTQATGGFGYLDQANVFHNAMNIQVKVRDVGNGTLATGVTDSAGRFSICFDSAAAPRLYVTIVSENSIWRVQNNISGNAFDWSTGVRPNPVPGSTVDFGTMTPGDPADYRAVHAFDEANDAWLFVPRAGRLCFDQDDTTCRKLIIRWGRTTPPEPVPDPDPTRPEYRTSFANGPNEVRLLPDDPNGRMIVVHEIGHAIMDDVYNDDVTRVDCTGHAIETAMNGDCAWSEGFADWLPLGVYGSGRFEFPSGSTVELEFASWDTTGIARGDATEGRVAGALLDIIDTRRESDYDIFGEGLNTIWTTFTRHIDRTFASFWAGRTADGFNVADTGALSSVYQNTIDYGFREPLNDNTPLFRQQPVPHNYGLNTGTPTWSVITLAPNQGADYDLDLYDDRAQVTPRLSSSTLGGPAVDFVAIDSRSRPFGDYYPRVRTFTGVGPYDVEFLQGGLPAITPGVPWTGRFTPGQVVKIRDAFLTAGVPVTMTVTPSQGDLNPDLFAVTSNPLDPATWIKNRAQATASATTAGFNVPETLTFTPPTTGFYGIVIVNKEAGFGDFSLLLT